jgi:GT2 family glycosyltransferase
MRAADVFVFPSRYEACALVLLEALASGLPVVAARTTGGTELLTPESSVLIHDADDVPALADAVNDLVASAEMRSRMRVAARRLAESHSWDSMAERYLEIYSERIQGAAARSTACHSTMTPETRIPSLAILICTMNRPQELHRCLTSIGACAMQPREIVISDDSPDGTETAAVCSRFPLVRYFAGPRRGLCANRNAVIDRTAADFVSLLDDDVVVPADFMSRAFAIMARLPARTLITGTAIDAGRPVIPGNPSFLGFFGRPVNGEFKNINLICNLLPRTAFEEARFDEAIGYGYEDMDLCARLLARGYVIRHEPTLITTHLPPRSTSSDRERFVMVGRARFYTSVKRYLLYERSLTKLAAFILAAPLHRVLHAIKARKWFDVPHALPDMWFAVRASLREQGRQRVTGAFR